jgi:hypothetical protein
MGPSSSPLLAARFGGRPGILDLGRGEKLLAQAGEDLVEEGAEEEALL